jgi:glycine/D-amino acid oxidase-like deaminating enzyme
MQSLSTYDVLVIGGGTAGVIAALQASRAGARTLLIEKNGLLGGTMTAGGVNFPGLFHAWGQQIVSGIGWELVERCVRECGLTMPDFSQQKAAEHWKQQIRIDRAIYAALCDEAILQAGVELLLHAMLASLQDLGDRWQVRVCTKTGLMDVHARVIVDCTGDANAASIAGFPTRLLEACQPATLICHASGYDPDSLDWESLEMAYDEEVRQGNLRYTDSGWNPTRFTGKWLSTYGESANHILGFDAGDSQGKTRLEMAGRQSLLRLYRFLRKQPGLQNLRIDYLAPECGVRETTTILGKGTVTVQDYASGRRWVDAVCYSYYPIDLHIEGAGEVDIHPLQDGIVPSIPRRALLPQGSRNFLVAGRCISSDRLANSALRTQASCMATGQAAGAIACLASASGMEVEAIPITEVHRLLAEHRAIVPDLA